MVDMKLALALLFAVASISLAPSAAQADTTTGPARILIVGDSVTQGKVGDYTWRYRLWNALQAQDKSVDLVGPLTAVVGGSTSYADPNFDQDHAARWGADLVAGGWWANDGLPTYVTTDLVSAYQPDVVINELGVNNLTWLAETPQAVIDLMSQFVSDVRSVDPNATVILGELTQTWFANVPEYNALLDTLAASLDQPDARVIVATRPADYVQGVDTYDPAHPTAAGEVKIAAQFADALAGLSLPNKPPLPAPAYSGAAHLVAAARRHAARLTFTTPAGATRQAVWKRDVTRHGHWRLVAYVPASTHRYRATSLRRHHRYTFELRAYHGSLMSTAYSNRAVLRTR
jgi:lysophospholipase L1-like esterase